MKGTLTYMIHTFRPSEEIRKTFKDCVVQEIEPQTFQITASVDVDPENPYKAMEEYQAETGEDCFEVFTIRTEDGKEYTEEEYED